MLCFSWYGWDVDRIILIFSKRSLSRFDVTVYTHEFFILYYLELNFKAHFWRNFLWSLFCFAVPIIAGLVGFIRSILFVLPIEIWHSAAWNIFFCLVNIHWENLKLRSLYLPIDYYYSIFIALDHNTPWNTRVFIKNSATFFRITELIK